MRIQKLRVRSAVGGAGKVHWKAGEQDGFPEGDQQVAFTIPAGKDWQDITVQLPVKKKTQIVRLYLPASDSPVEIQSIRYEAKGGKLIKAWDFKNANPSE